MLLEFAVQNFKSFKELQVFSLEASTEPSKDDGVHRIIEKDGYRIAKTKAIYGANASGKSNLIMGLVAFWQIVKNNLKDPSILSFCMPYRLDRECLAKPTYFQIIFIREGIKYRYGFEATSKKIHSEWLYAKKNKEVMLFEREGNTLLDYNKTGFKEGKEIHRKDVNLLKDTSLLISVLNALNFPVSKLITSSINSKIAISPEPLRDTFNHWHKNSQYSFETDSKFSNWASKLLKEIDGTIDNLRLAKDNHNPDSPVFTLIERTGSNGTQSVFILETEEASGTQKIFDYSNIIYKCISHGYTLILDELDALLHPKLTRKLIELFQSQDSHPDAQLIFATHDTNLLDHELLRRDQITFVEKVDKGYSEIFDLSDIKGVRAKDLFEKNYLKGNYGALPTLNRMEKVLLDKELVNA